MTHLARFPVHIFLCMFLLACSSSPKAVEDSGEAKPEWTQAGTRSVEGNRIVYVGRATAVNKETAVAKAEGSALEDIANECSMVPKSTRVESRYSVRGTYEYDVRVKVSVEWAECDLARQTIDPGAIRYYANAPLTAQLLQYQDRNEDLKPQVLEIQPPQELPGVPERDSHWDDTQHYYVLRQALVYLKMIAVLAPKDAYAPFSAQAKQYAGSVQPVVQQLNSMQINNPALKDKPLAWTELHDRPRILRPDALVKRASLQPEAKSNRKKGGPVKPPPAQFPKKNATDESAR